MNLKTYLASINMKMKDFGEIIGCHATYISHISNGQKIPGKRLAKDIMKLTNGKVLPSSFKLKEKQQKGLEV